MVIAIIAILAAMLLPSLGKARDKAKQVHCTNNVASLTRFLTLYADDYNSWSIGTYYGGFQWSTSDASSTSGCYGWFRHLVEKTGYLKPAPYGKSSYARCGAVPSGTYTATQKASAYISDYGFNAEMGGTTWQSWQSSVSDVKKIKGDRRIWGMDIRSAYGWAYVKTDSIDNPSGVVMLGDGAPTKDAMIYNYTLVQAGNIWDMSFRHNDSMNMGFFDTHVEAVSREKFKTVSVETGHPNLNSLKWPWY